jgi:hypothetical protein
MGGDHETSAVTSDHRVAVAWVGASGGGDGMVVLAYPALVSPPPTAYTRTVDDAGSSRRPFSVMGGASRVSLSRTPLDVWTSTMYDVARHPDDELGADHTRTAVWRDRRVATRPVGAAGASRSIVAVAEAEEPSSKMDEIIKV